MGPLQDAIPKHIDFFEVAPENWIGVGGRLGDAFAAIAGERPLACHGLLLDLGGPDALDFDFLARLRAFLDRHEVVVYGDHLTFSGAGGLLYELLPIPFTQEAVHHVAARIRVVQDFLGRRIAIENASYYLQLAQDLDEATFINAVLEESDCDLLLDINNVYVNSVNQDYDPHAFVCALSAERIAYAHIAGHAHEAEDLIVDTHGADVIDPVWSLLEHAYAQFGVFPTLLERDENIPSLAAVMVEVERIRRAQAAHTLEAAQASR